MSLRVPETTEDLKWQEIYKNCRSTQERFLYAELRIKEGMTADEAREYTNKNFHYREMVCNVKPSAKQSSTSLSINELGGQHETTK